MYQQNTYTVVYSDRSLAAPRLNGRAPSMARLTSSGWHTTQRPKKKAQRSTGGRWGRVRVARRAARCVPRAVVTTGVCCREEAKASFPDRLPALTVWRAQL